MHKNTEELARIPRESLVTLWSSEGSLSGTLYKGALKTVNIKNDTAQLYNTVYEKLEQVNLIHVTSIEAHDASGRPVCVSEDDPLIDDFPPPPTSGWSGGIWLSPPGINTDEWPNSAFLRIAPGTYLMVTGEFGDAINPTIRQGKLLSVDFDKKLVRLESTVYEGRIDDVPLDKNQIISVDDSRSGPGALGPAQSPDWRFNGDKWVRSD